MKQHGLFQVISPSKMVQQYHSKCYSTVLLSVVINFLWAKLIWKEVLFSNFWHFTWKCNRCWGWPVALFSQLDTSWWLLALPITSCLVWHPPLIKNLQHQINVVLLPWKIFHQAPQTCSCFFNNTMDILLHHTSVFNVSFNNIANFSHTIGNSNGWLSQPDLYYSTLNKRFVHIHTENWIAS